MAKKIKHLNKIHHGDVLNIMKKIPSNSIHLAITSPPYNVGKEYDNHNDNMNYEEYLKWLNKVWKETKRVLVPGGFVFHHTAYGLDEWDKRYSDAGLSKDEKKPGLFWKKINEVA